MALRAWQDDQPSEKALSFLQELLRGYRPRNFRVELWDGSGWEPESGQFCRFTWKVNHPGALRAAFESSSQVTVAEAYIYGDFDLEGDIEAVFPLADYLLTKNRSGMEKLRLAALLRELPPSSHALPLRPTGRLPGQLHSKERDRRAVSYHYDLSNDFYALWLGREMAYSCAYFVSPEDDLDTAQRQKFDYICRKLRLQPEERLLDIGCGWGGLTLHAAREFGVHALGITLSEQQRVLAQERIQAAGLAQRCEVRLLDYRDLDAPASYDKLVSIGMVEHVGEANLREYFRRAIGLLRPGGVFLNHGIGAPQNRFPSRGATFGDLYVFPDAELPPIGVTTRYAEEAGFEVRDVENLREHYALTLERWVRGIEAHAEAARRLVDEVIYRTWRLHMAGSAYYFARGLLGLYQTLLVKTMDGRSGMPLTRADWYPSD